jgi:hypothetical protein
MNRNAANFLESALCLSLLVNIIGAKSSLADTLPTIAPNHASLLALDLVSGTYFDSSRPSSITQMAFGSDGRLYAITLYSGVLSFRYDPSTGILSDKKTAFSTGGLGIGFHKNQMYICTGSSIIRLGDEDSDGRWGESGETNIILVEGIPTGDHSANHIQIHGNTLYLGIGVRTIDGLYTRLFDSNDTLGESSYGGSVAWIQDLTQVPNIPNAAQLRNSSGTLLSNLDFITDGAPYTSTETNKLIIHSSGLRNPFGIAFDAAGSLWISNNYGRANSTTAGGSVPHPNDALDDDFSDDIHDQFFRASIKSDYGYANGNWRTNSIATSAGYFNSANRRNSTTFDNLNPSDSRFHTLHDPANPDGFGPSSSADGFTFYTGDQLPSAYRNKAFVTRFTTGPLVETDGDHSLSYADVVLVDPGTSKVARIASGFINPLDALADQKGVFVADFSSGIYRIRSATSTTGNQFYPVLPCRIADTRKIATQNLPIGSPTAFVVNTGGLAYNYSSQGGSASGCGIPNDAKAVFFNFVAVNPTSSGFLQAWPFGTAIPTASVLNYAAIPNFNIANGIILPVCNPSTAVCSKDLNVQANQSSVQLVIDAVGYFK